MGTEAEYPGIARNTVKRLIQTLMEVEQLKQEAHVRTSNSSRLLYELKRLLSV